MAIIISSATDKEFEKISEKMWRDEDIEHYGKPVNWTIKDFIFKATDDSKIIGRIDGKIEAGVMFIDSLIVDKNHRGLGVGKKLVEAVETFGKEQKAHKVYLFTMQEWRASEFYVRLGYKKTGNLPKHYLKRDFIIFSKIL